jgi:hypothetical protein
MALTQFELQSIIQLIRQDPEVRRQFQDALQLDGLLELPTRMDRVEAALEKVAESQRRSEERLDRLEETVARLVEAQLRTEVAVQEVRKEVSLLGEWRKGEDGRRNGEQYERRIERRAPALLGGGMGGGTQRDVVYSRVQELLAPLYQEDDLASEADPMLADIIWWKADRYVVAEVSIRVDRLDVLRAAQRAESLRKAGVAATGVVIGDEWVADDTLALAEEESVEWKVGNAYSPGLIEYRRIVA